MAWASELSNVRAKVENTASGSSDAASMVLARLFDGKGVYGCNAQLIWSRMNQTYRDKSTNTGFDFSPRGRLKDGHTTFFEGQRCETVCFARCYSHEGLAAILSRPQSCQTLLAEKVVSPFWKNHEAHFMPPCVESDSDVGNFVLRQKNVPMGIRCTHSFTFT